jgi:hypothetical protein
MKTITHIQMNLMQKLTLAVVMALFMQPAYAGSVSVSTEATVRSGTHADDDQYEADAGYVHVKYHAEGDHSRKAYFQFDLTDKNVDLAKAATFTFYLQAPRAQAIRVWVLDQAYADLTSTVTWNKAQANDTKSNDMLEIGKRSATPIRGVIQVPGRKKGEAVNVKLDALLPYVFDNKITFVITGADDSKLPITNDQGGLRIALSTSETPATLTFEQLKPEPDAQVFPATNDNPTLRRHRLGAAQFTHNNRFLPDLPQRCGD